MSVLNPAYPASRGLPGAMVRLLSEDWHAMTEDALASDNHVSKLARWEKLAREQNPALDDVQVIRLAEMLRTQHYQRMGRLSGQARRIASEAAAELAIADEVG